MTYTKEDIEAGKGCFYEYPTKIAQITSGPDAGKYITCDQSDALGGNLILAGTAHPVLKGRDFKGVKVSWL